MIIIINNRCLTFANEFIVVKGGNELLTGSPAPVLPEHLHDYHIKVD